MIKLLLVDDNEIVRDGIKRLFSEEPAIELLGEATNGLEAIKMLKTMSPDVILMDIGMPEMDGIEALRIITEQYPEIQILMLSMYNNRRHIKRAFASGATGYLLKNSPRNILFQAIMTVYSGTFFIDPEIQLEEILFLGQAIDDF